MVSADFSQQALLRSGDFMPFRCVCETSRGKTRFFPSTYLPHLRYGFPYSFRALAWEAALPTRLRLMRFLFVRPEVCHPASFRFHLAMDTLALGYALPAVGRARDFHPLENVPCSAHLARTCQERHLRLGGCAREPLPSSLKRLTSPSHAQQIALNAKEAHPKASLFVVKIASRRFSAC